MKLTKISTPSRGHYDGDKLSRICTTWTRTNEHCSDCGSAIMRGQCEGRSDVFACSGCAAVFAEVEMAPNTPVTDAEPSTPANTRAQSPRSV